MDQVMNNQIIFWSSTQLIFAGICLFGMIIGITTVFKYSKEDRDFYYPTWLVAVGFYILHFLEVIYVFDNLSDTSLRFINAMGMLIPINLTLLTWDKYFFFQKTNIRIKLLSIIPLIALIPLFIQLEWDYLLPDTVTQAIPYLVIASLILNILFFVCYQYYCTKKQSKVYEMEYSNISDFPKNFAIQMCILLGAWVALHMLLYFTNNHNIKAWVDILRSVIAIGVTLLWMGENRSKKEEIATRNIENQNTIHENNAESNELKLLESLHQLLKSEKLYLNPGLRLSDLTPLLGTNRTYLSRAINSIPEQSFYSIIQEYRVSYAKEILQKMPNMNLETLADESGFTSRSHFSRIFKEIEGLTPSEYRRQCMAQAI